MAKTKFGLNFDGFLDYAEQIDKLGEGYLKKAVDNALTASKDYANQAILEAMEKSPFAFKENQQSNKGVGRVASGTGKNRRASGKANKSLLTVDQQPVTWEGNEAVAYIGPDLKEAPEALILAIGTPHIKGDKNLNNALKVKGKYRKEVSRIQQQEFMKVLEEAQNG